MADFRVYLNAEELAYVKQHDKGFVRGLVQWSMDHAKRARQEQAERQPQRTEVRERFEEVP